MSDLTISLGDELIEAIATRAADLVHARPERWLTPKELAEHFGCSVRTVSNYHRAGMPHLMIGSKPRYRASDVEAWLTASGNGGRVAPFANRGGDRHQRPRPMTREVTPDGKAA
jgi:excisionase family DNA binding protein